MEQSAPTMSTHTTRNRSQATLRKTDLSEGTILRDEVYDERVEVVGLYVGQVYLRYPHQEAKVLYRHECGSDCLGYAELESHAAECDEGNPDWWETTDPGRLTEMEENDEVPFERLEKPDGMHVEACSYDWPLDGHRFTILEA